MGFLQRTLNDVFQKLFNVTAKDETVSKAPDLHLSPANYIYLAIWFGLFTGLGEVALYGLRKFYFHHNIGLGIDVIWMTPLFDMLLFGFVGGVLSWGAYYRRTLISLPTTVFIYTLLAFFSLYLVRPKLYFWAALLLGVGVAVQMARFAGSRPHFFCGIINLPLGWAKLFGIGRRPATKPDIAGSPDALLLANRRQFLVGAGATVAGLAVGVQSWQSYQNRRTLAALPSEFSKDAPNVLFIVLDTVRAQSLSLYGYQRPTTPWLEQYAKGAVKFDRAIAPSSWTLPSHGSIFTGHFPHKLSTGFQEPLDNTYPTLAELLAVNGYETAGFVANLSYCSGEFGLNRGFTYYEDRIVTPGTFVQSSSLARYVGSDETVRDWIGYHEFLDRKGAGQVNQPFLRWLSQRDEQRPFFAFLNYYDAHDPYLPPLEFALKFATERPRGNLMPGEVDKLSPQDIQELNDAYDSSLAYLDYQLELLFVQLEKLGALENTMVIITSDHGEQFGEHNLMLHINSLYMPLIHVPLLISYPGHMPAGINLAQAVGLQDLAATIFDLTGLKSRVNFPGYSLAHYWMDNGTREARPVLSEVKQAWGFPAWYPGMKGPLKSIVFEGMHYIKNYGDGQEELYELDTDPEEARNLADSSAGRQAVKSFQKLLDTLLA